MIMDRGKLVVEIADGSSVVTAHFRTNDGVLTTKTIAIADLLVLLRNNMESTTGILPSGTKFYTGTKNAYSIGIQVPAKVRTAQFRLHDLRTLTVPFPESLCVFSVYEQQITHSKLFACIPPVGRTDDPLFRFPFGNVSENGEICWGDIRHPKIVEPIALDAVVGRFFNSVFSGHLVNGTNMFRTQDGIMNLRTLLEHLEGKEHFPDQLLKVSDVTLHMAMMPQNGR